jgi:hypothetical protein
MRRGKYSNVRNIHPIILKWHSKSAEKTRYWFKMITKQYLFVRVFPFPQSSFLYSIPFSYFSLLSLNSFLPLSYEFLLSTLLFCLLYPHFPVCVQRIYMFLILSIFITYPVQNFYHFQIVVFWVVTPCSLVDRYRFFRETWWLNFRVQHRHSPEDHNLNSHHWKPQNYMFSILHLILS